jgi:hypothetical protein
VYGDVALEEWRDYIESEIDRMLQEQIVGDVEWVQKEAVVSSLRDLALGYMIGLLRGLILGIGAARTTEDYEEVERKAQVIIKRRIPDIIKRIEEELDN